MLTRFFCRLAFVFAALVSGPTLAEPSAADRQLSADFTRQALEQLQTGDRGAAMLSALRALPAAPQAEDEIHFGKAFDALLLSVASRGVRLPIEREVHAVLSSGGDRLATLGFGLMGQISPQDDLMLWDPQNGQQIATVMSASSLFGNALSSTPPVMSLDGTLLAAHSTLTSQVFVFDAKTGQARTTLGPASGGEEGGALMFSRDGQSLYAILGRPTQLIRWDVATWTGTAIATFDRCQMPNFLPSGIRPEAIFLNIRYSPGLRHS